MGLLKMFGINHLNPQADLIHFNVSTGVGRVTCQTRPNGLGSALTKKNKQKKKN